MQAADEHEVSVHRRPVVPFSHERTTPETEPERKRRVSPRPRQQRSHRARSRSSKPSDPSAHLATRLRTKHRSSVPLSACMVARQHYHYHEARALITVPRRVSPR